MAPGANNLMEEVVCIDDRGPRPVMVDRMLMTMLRHHAADDREINGLLLLLAEPCTSAQIAAVLGIVGRRLPFAASYLYVERKQNGSRLLADLRLPGSIRWHGSSLRLPTGSLPTSVVSAIVPGTPLRRIVDHPYLCEHVVVRGVKEETGEIQIQARHKPPRATS